MCTNLSKKCKLSKKGSPGKILTDFFKISVLKNFGNFTEKHFCWRHFSKKVAIMKALLKRDFKAGVFL